MDKKFWIGLAVAWTLSVVFYWIYPVWQLVVLIGIVSGIIVEEGREGFVSSFVGVLIGWLTLLGFQSLNYPIKDAASLLAEIIGLGGGLWYVIVILTLLIGGLIAGFSGMVGACGRSLIESRKTEEAEENKETEEE